MEKFILNITASSGEFYQGYCESLTLPTGDGVYGVQAGHNPVLVALHMALQSSPWTVRPARCWWATALQK